MNIMVITIFGGSWGCVRRDLCEGLNGKHGQVCGVRCLMGMYQDGFNGLFHKPKVNWTFSFSGIIGCLRDVDRYATMGV